MDYNDTGPLHDYKRHGTGKWVAFDFDHTRLKIIIRKEDSVKSGIIDDPEQLAQLLDVIQRGPNNLFVGVYEATHHSFDMEHTRSVLMPAVVVPQLSTTGDCAYWAVPGSQQAYRLNIPVYGITHLELINDLKWIPQRRVFNPNHVFNNKRVER